jgi:hypothetical protein
MASPYSNILKKLKDKEKNRGIAPEVDTWREYYLKAGPVEFAEKELACPIGLPLHPIYGVPKYVILSDDQKEFLTDLFNKNKFSIVSASRGAGKTFSVAIYVCWCIVVYDFFESTIMGGSSAQSEIIQNYIEYWMYHNKKLDYVIDKSIRGNLNPHIETKWGSVARFVGASKTSTRGHHVKLIIIDEVVSAEEKGADGEAAVRAIWWQMIGKEDAQLVMLSTAHSVFGTFYEYYNGDIGKEFKKYRWSIAKHISGETNPYKIYDDENPDNWKPNVWWVSEKDLRGLRIAKTNDEFLCLLGDSIIYGVNKPIKTINVGEKVTGYDKNTEVLATTKRKYSGELIEIKPRNIQQVSFTPEHPIAVCNINRKTLCKKPKKNYKTGNYSGIKYEINNKRFEQAKNITTDDYLILPRNNNGRVEVDDDYAKLLGWYLAEGSMSNGQVTLSLGYTEVKEAKELSDIIQKYFNRKATPHRYGSVIKVSFRCKGKTDIFKLFNTKAYKKQIPDFIKNDWCEKSLRVFISSYVDGDGIKTKDGGYAWLVGTASKQIMLDLTEILIKIGIVPYIHYNEKSIKKITTNKKTYEAYFKENWFISWSFNRWNKKPKCPFYIVKKNFIYLPIKNITKKTVKNIEVYNLDTKQNVFCVPFLVHNCEALGGFSQMGGLLFRHDHIERAVCNRKECEICEPYTGNCFLVNEYRIGENACHITERVGGIDWGDRSPNAMTILGRHGDKVFVLFNDEVITALVEEKLMWAKEYLDKWCVDLLYPDPEERGMIQALENIGDYSIIKIWEVLGQKAKRELMINAKMHMEKDKLVIPRKYTHLINSLKQMSLDEHGNIVKRNDHSYDSFAYALNEYNENDSLSEFYMLEGREIKKIWK